MKVLFSTSLAVALMSLAAAQAAATQVFESQHDAGCLAAVQSADNSGQAVICKLSAEDHLIDANRESGNSRCIDLAIAQVNLAVSAMAYQREGLDADAIPTANASRNLNAEITNKCGDPAILSGAARVMSNLDKVFGPP
ncbi:MAG: hypothetical protein ABI231_05905 [Candidatus Tumulicola sp.]